MLGSAKAFMATGAGVLMMNCRFYIMAKAAVVLAKSGKVQLYCGMAVVLYRAVRSGTRSFNKAMGLNDHQS